MGVGESLAPQDLISCDAESPKSTCSGWAASAPMSAPRTRQRGGRRPRQRWVRIDGRDLRCKVVGEGANLGFTQRGHIEAAFRGTLNTDAIDNSAGVNTSDMEVNLKIPLNILVGTAGDMDGKQCRCWPR